MGIVQRAGRRAGRRVILLVIPALAVALLLGQHPGRAADLKVVEGIVKSVSGTEIEVGGKSFNISGVPLRTASRKAVSPAELPGRKVALYFRGGVLISVLVYPNIVE